MDALPVRQAPLPERGSLVTRDMELLDPFARTFLPAAAAAGVDITTVSRHISVLRRCVGAAAEPVLVARCSRLDRTFGGGLHLLVLTPQRLVVTVESRILRRLRLHLNTDVRHLSDVLWTPEPSLGGVQLSATAIDGVREHFWLRAADADRVGKLLQRVFRPVPVTV
jgi:hypothetical protein